MSLSPNISPALVSNGYGIGQTNGTAILAFDNYIVPIIRMTFFFSVEGKPVCFGDTSDNPYSIIIMKHQKGEIIHGHLTIRNDSGHIFLDSDSDLITGKLVLVAGPFSKRTGGVSQKVFGLNFLCTADQGQTLTALDYDTSAPVVNCWYHECHILRHLIPSYENTLPDQRSTPVGNPWGGADNELPLG